MKQYLFLSLMFIIIVPSVIAAIPPDSINPPSGGSPAQLPQNEGGSLPSPSEVGGPLQDQADKTFTDWNDANANNGRVTEAAEAELDHPKDPVFVKGAKGIGGNADKHSFQQVDELTQGGTSLEQGTNVVIEEDGTITADHVGSLNVGEKVKLTDAKGVTLTPDGCFEIQQASIIDFFGVSNSDVSNFDGCDKVYHIDKADSVRAGCFDARGVTNADFEINDGLCI